MSQSSPQLRRGSLSVPAASVEAMADAVGRTVAQKMGLRPGSRAQVVNAPDAALAGLVLPALEVSDALTGDVDYLHLFVTTSDAMREAFPVLASI